MASKYYRRYAEVLSATGGASRLTRRKTAGLPQPGTVIQYTVAGPNGGLIVGPDQNIWFLMDGDVAYFDPSTQTTQAFNATTGLIQQLAVGSDGNVWFVVSWGMPGQVGRCTPGGSVSTWPILGFSTGLVLGNDGNIWFNELAANSLPGRRIGCVTPDGTVSQYLTSSDTYDPIVGPDGNIWFGERGPLIGTVTSSGSVTEYNALPATMDLLVTPDRNIWFGSYTDIGFVTPAGALTTIPTGGNGTFGLILGPDGDTVWFGSQSTNQIGQAALDGTLIGMYDTSGLPMGLCAGGDGNVWFTQLADAIGCATPGAAVSNTPRAARARTLRSSVPTATSGFPTADRLARSTTSVCVTPGGAVSELNTNALPRLTEQPAGWRFGIPASSGRPT